MKINNNTWNKLRYTLYSPFYDSVAGFLKNSRRKSISQLGIKEGDKVLIVGAGTGLDLEFLPNFCEITATDITPSMVERIKKRNKKLLRNLKTHVMDGQKLDFEDNTFDFVILHLILAVIPNPNACIQEAERVLKPNGQVAVYDKFVKKNSKISFSRKFANFFSNMFFTDITRHFETILSASKLTLISDIDADFNGNFRLIKLQKKGS